MLHQVLDLFNRLFYRFLSVQLQRLVRDPCLRICRPVLGILSSLGDGRDGDSSDDLNFSSFFAAFFFPLVITEVSVTPAYLDIWVFRASEVEPSGPRIFDLCIWVRLSGRTKISTSRLLGQ